MTTEARPAPSPLAVAGPWDLVSAGYAAEAGAMMRPFTLDALQLAAPGPTAEVLDVATGPGVLALEVAPRVRRVDAVDFSESMLAELERKRDALGIGNVFARVADGQDLPFADASFDAAFSMFGLMFFPDRNRGFSELHRTLRPGGVAVVSSWAPVDQSPLMQLMFGALCAADPSRPAPKTNLLNLENPDLFRRELEQAGFHDVRVEPYTHGVRAESAEQMWHAMTRSSAPLVLLQRKLGPEEWERQSLLAKAYVVEQLPAPRELTTTAFLGFGRR
jgi:SAM-dependent methyltransferase